MKVKNIYVVEDDRFFAETFIKKLGKMGDFKIHHFISVESALGKLSRIKPEIIFLDHYLGGVNGVDAIPLFKEFHEAGEIVVVSNQTVPEVLGKALESGATKYFPKNVLLTTSTEDFIQEIQNKETKYDSFWGSFLKSYSSVPGKS